MFLPLLKLQLECSVQFSRSVVSDSLRPHGLQHTRPLCPPPTPRVHPNSCPLSWWCHSTISSCHPLLLFPSIFPSIKVFPNELALRIRWPKYWASALASVFPMNIIHCSYGDELQSYSSYRDEFSPWRNLELRMTDLSNSTGYVKWVCTFSVDQATSSPCENSHLKNKRF